MCLGTVSPLMHSIVAGDPLATMQSEAADGTGQVFHVVHDAKHFDGYAHGKEITHDPDA
jgi:hypothetical protein